MPRPLEEQLEDHFGAKLEKCASSCYKIPGSNRKVFVKVGQGGSHFKGDTLHRYEFEGLKHLRQHCVGVQFIRAGTIAVWSQREGLGVYMRGILGH